MYVYMYVSLFVHMDLMYGYFIGAVVSLSHPDLKSFLDDLASQLPTDNIANSMESLLQLPLDRISQYPSMFKVNGTSHQPLVPDCY